MTRPLKVYGWQSFRNDRRIEHNGHWQTREICAAFSKAEVARIVGVKSVSALHNICETGNDKEVALATAKPHTVFFTAITRGGEYFEDSRVSA